MGHWKIVIEGVGGNNNNLPTDADYIARKFALALARDGQSIGSATFTLNPENPEFAKVSTLPTTEPECSPHPSMAAVLQFFAFAHLPPTLQAASKPFADLAHRISQGPQNAEATVALRKLLEAKDAAVRAVLSKPT